MFRISRDSAPLSAFSILNLPQLPECNLAPGGEFHMDPAEDTSEPNRVVNSSAKPATSPAGPRLRRFSAKKAAWAAGQWLTTAQPMERKSEPKTLQHFARKAKHVIYLHMVGGPSQMDLFDYKPEMNEWYDKDLPESIRKGQRLTTMTSRPGAVPDRARRSTSSRSTASAACGSASCCRNTAKMVDDICFIRSMHTEAINHEPAITFMQTGNQITGRPCLGSWAVVRPRLAERQPADLRRAGRQADATPSRSRRSPPGSGRPAILPASTPASPSAAGGDPILLHQQSARRLRASPPRERSTASTQLNEMNFEQIGDPGDRTPASRSTRWPSACSPACRS